MTKYEWMKGHIDLILESWTRAYANLDLRQMALWLSRYQELCYNIDELTVEEAAEIVFVRWE